MRRFIGDRAFYRRVVAIVLPIIIQNTVTNFVSLLDNVMVGRIGTEQMSGVAIANQLLFIFNLCIFGGLSGAGIFGAQFYGQGNHDGVRSTFRFKLLTGAFVLVVALAVFIPFGPTLISHYLTDGEGAGDLALTFAHSKSYMRIMLFGLLPFALTQCYSGTLRDGRNEAADGREYYRGLDEPLLKLRHDLRKARVSGAWQRRRGLRDRDLPLCRTCYRSHGHAPA